MEKFAEKKEQKQIERNGEETHVEEREEYKDKLVSKETATTTLKKIEQENLYKIKKEQIQRKKIEELKERLRRASAEEYLKIIRKESKNWGKQTFLNFFGEEKLKVEFCIQLYKLNRDIDNKRSDIVIISKIPFVRDMIKETYKRVYHAFLLSMKDDSFLELIIAYKKTKDILCDLEIMKSYEKKVMNCLSMSSDDTEWKGKAKRVALKYRKKEEVDMKLKRNESVKNLYQNMQEIVEEELERYSLKIRKFFYYSGEFGIGGKNDNEVIELFQDVIKDEINKFVLEKFGNNSKAEDEDSFENIYWRELQEPIFQIFENDSEAEDEDSFENICLLKLQETVFQILNAININQLEDDLKDLQEDTTEGAVISGKEFEDMFQLQLGLAYLASATCLDPVTREKPRLSSEESKELSEVEKRILYPFYSLEDAYNEEENRRAYEQQNLDKELYELVEYFFKEISNMLAQKSIKLLREDYEKQKIEELKERLRKASAKEYLEIIGKESKNWDEQTFLNFFGEEKLKVEFCIQLYELNGDNSSDIVIISEILFARDMIKETYKRVYHAFLLSMKNDPFLERIIAYKKTQDILCDLEKKGNECLSMSSDDTEWKEIKIFQVSIKEKINKFMSEKFDNNSGAEDEEFSKNICWPELQETVFQILNAININQLEDDLKDLQEDTTEGAVISGKEFKDMFQLQLGLACWASSSEESKQLLEVEKRILYPFYSLEDAYNEEENRNAYEQQNDKELYEQVKYFFKKISNMLAQKSIKLLREDYEKQKIEELKERLRKASAKEYLEIIGEESENWDKQTFLNFFGEEKLKVEFCIQLYKLNGDNSSDIVNKISEIPFVNGYEKAMYKRVYHAFLLSMKDDPFLERIIAYKKIQDILCDLAKIKSYEKKGNECLSMSSDDTEWKEKAKRVALKYRKKEEVDMKLKRNENVENLYQNMQKIVEEELKSSEKIGIYYNEILGIGGKNDNGVIELFQVSIKEKINKFMLEKFGNNRGANEDSFGNIFWLRSQETVFQILNAININQLEDDLKDLQEDTTEGAVISGKEFEDMPKLQLGLACLASATCLDDVTREKPRLSSEESKQLLEAEKRILYSFYFLKDAYNEEEKRNACELHIKLKKELYAQVKYFFKKISNMLAEKSIELLCNDYDQKQRNNVSKETVTTMSEVTKQENLDKINKEQSQKQKIEELKKKLQEVPIEQYLETVEEALKEWDEQEFLNMFEGNAKLRAEFCIQLCKLEQGEAYTNKIANLEVVKQVVKFSYRSFENDLMRKLKSKRLFESLVLYKKIKEIDSDIGELYNLASKLKKYNDFSEDNDRTNELFLRQRQIGLKYLDEKKLDSKLIDEQEKYQKQEDSQLIDHKEARDQEAYFIVNLVEEAVEKSREQYQKSLGRSLGIWSKKTLRDRLSDSIRDFLWRMLDQESGFLSGYLFSIEEGRHRFSVKEEKRQKNLRDIYRQKIQETVMEMIEKMDIKKLEEISPYNPESLEEENDFKICEKQLDKLYCLQLGLSCIVAAKQKDVSMQNQLLKLGKEVLYPLYCLNDDCRDSNVRAISLDEKIYQQIEGIFTQIMRDFLENV